VDLGLKVLSQNGPGDYEAERTQTLKISQAMGDKIRYGERGDRTTRRRT